MKKLIKTICVALIALCATLLTGLPATAQVTIYHFEFTKVDGGYQIKAKSGVTLTGELEIPSTYNDEPIVEIGSFYQQKFTSVVIPNTVTTISNNAFQQCGNLTSISIPNSVKTIGSAAFFGCTKLTSVSLGNSIQSIGYRTFGNCTSL
ncbi:MAG: leucine-rich repeat domain-containing protein, partial [Bacteroidales bacterium]|nr:leucine-rich repeat domain-containing protein [Bacteroidales bacterium]